MDNIQLNHEEQETFNYLRDNHTKTDAFLRLSHPSVTRNVLIKFFLMSASHAIPVSLREAIANHRLLTDQDIIALILESKDQVLLKRRYLGPSVFQTVFTSHDLSLMRPAAIAHPNCPVSYLLRCLDADTKSDFYGEMYILDQMKSAAIQHPSLPLSYVTQLAELDIDKCLKREAAGFSSPELSILANPNCPRSLLSAILKELIDTYQVEIKGNPSMVRLATIILANPNCDPQDLASVDIVESFNSGSRLWEGAIKNPNLPITAIRKSMVIDGIDNYLIDNPALPADILLEIALRFNSSSPLKVQERVMQHANANLKVLLCGVLLSTSTNSIQAYALLAAQTPPWLYQLMHWDV